MICGLIKCKKQLENINTFYSKLSFWLSQAMVVVAKIWKWAYTGCVDCLFPLNRNFLERTFTFPFLISLGEEKSGTSSSSSIKHSVVMKVFSINAIWLFIRREYTLSFHINYILQLRTSTTYVNRICVGINTSHQLNSYNFILPHIKYRELFSGYIVVRYLNEIHIQQHKTWKVFRHFPSRFFFFQKKM